MNATEQWTLYTEGMRLVPYWADRVEQAVGHANATIFADLERRANRAGLLVVDSQMGATEETATGWRIILRVLEPFGKVLAVIDADSEAKAHQYMTETIQQIGPKDAGLVEQARRMIAGAEGWN